MSLRSSTTSLFGADSLTYIDLGIDAGGGTTGATTGGGTTFAFRVFLTLTGTGATTGGGTTGGGTMGEMAGGGTTVFTFRVFFGFEFTFRVFLTLIDGVGA
jgi:hypothetical protein